MIRVGVAVTLAVALAAPLQCGHGSSDPALRAEDSPGDALWALALDFRAKGNEESARATMHFLSTKYPSNRHATEARAELDAKPVPPRK